MRLQSMKPKVAKKADENKIQATPTPAPGFAMAVPKKKDEAEAARFGKVEEEGEGNGVYSQFLHDWLANILSTYKSGAEQYPCKPRVDIQYLNGHVLDAEPIDTCGGAADRAMVAAIRDAPRPPMPVGMANEQHGFTFIPGRGD